MTGTKQFANFGGKRVSPPTIKKRVVLLYLAHFMRKTPF